MGHENHNSAKYRKDGNFGGANYCAKERNNVPPQERRRVVLEFLDEHGLPLSPKAIYRGLKIQRDITFGYRTVQNILAELAEEGYVMRVSKDALDEGRIDPLPENDSAQRAWYFISEKGRDRVR